MIFWISVGVVLLAALPFGGDRPWAAGLLASAVGLLLLMWAVRLWRGEATISVKPVHVWPPLACLGVVALWIVLQSSSWLPAGWDHPLWASAAEALDVDLAGAVGLAPHEAYTVLMRMLAYAGIFWLALEHAREPRLADGALHAVVAAATLVSMVGILRWVFGFGPEAGLAGTFDAPGPFAVYAALGAAVAFALSMSRLAAARSARGGPATVGLLPLAHAFAGPPAALPVVTLVLSIMAIMSGGAVALLAGLTATALALVIGDRPSRRPALVALVAVLLLVGPFAVGAGGGRGVDAVAERTRDAIADAPLYGTGAGSFPDAFRMYRDSRIPEAVERPQASLFAAAMELGIPATIVLAATLASVAVLCAVGVGRRRRGVAYPVVGLAATVVVAVDAVAGHALGAPAVAAAYALLAGVACAQCFGPPVADRPAPVGEPVRIVRAGDRPGTTRVAGPATDDG